MGLRRRTVLVLGVGTVLAIAGAQQLDDPPLSEAPRTPPPDVVTRHPIPADAVWVHPAGNDAFPGTRSQPRATLLPGATNALSGGTYRGFSQRLPVGTATTVIVPEGQTAVFDGLGTVAKALVCGGRTDLYGDLHITDYAPTSFAVGSNAPVYYGGTAAGSEIDGPRITYSRMAALGFQVPLLLTRLTVDGCGYSGILGTTADGTTFGDVEVYRVNRDNHDQDGQLGAVKVTRSADVRFSKGMYVEDTNGAMGLWTDVSCRRPVVTGAQVRTGAGKPADIGLLLEETEGGAVVDVDVEGAYAAELVATGHVQVWGNRMTGTTVALTVRQDRPMNSGTNPRNLDPSVAPWWAVGNVINDNTLVATGGSGIALTTRTEGDVIGALTSAEMLASLRGNTFVGSVQLETSPGVRESLDSAQLTALLGDTYSTTTPALPAGLAALAT